MDKRKTVIRWGIYALGLLILALGVTLNTKTGLGVSPMTCVPFAVTEIFGWNLGNTTLVSYVVFMLMQAVLKGRKAFISILLQLPLTYAFTRFINLFSDLFPMQTRLPGQLAMLAAAILLTGIGAALYLDMRLISNPPDGIVQAISDRAHKEMGLCKNLFDAANTALALVIGLTLGGRVIGIGIGTVAAVLGTGRVISLFNRLFLNKLRKLSGQDADR